MSSSLFGSLVFNMANQVDEGDVKAHLAPHAGELKYLGLVEVVAGVACVCAVRVYAVAKQWSGAWRPHISEVEKKVKQVVGPLFHLVEEGKEHDILVFIDQKLDVVVCAIRRHTPHLIKKWGDTIIEVAKKAPNFVVEVVAEVHRVGVVDTTKIYFNKAQPVAAEWTYIAWRHFLKLPFSLTLVHVATHPALVIGERVNMLISSLKEHNLPLVGYVPFLPLKRIETIIKREA